MPAKKSRKGKKKSTTISVNMAGVESSNKLDDGDYIFEVEEVSLETGQDSGNDYLKWKLKETDGGGIVYNNTSLVPAALFSLRNMLEAMGMDVPDSKMDLDLTDFPGLELGGTIANEVYQGKKRPNLVDVYPVTEGSNEEGEEDEPEEPEAEEEEAVEEKPKSSKKKAGKKAKKSKKITEGSDVTFEDDGDTYSGQVTDIDDDVFTVVDGDGDEWELGADDLTLV